MALRVGRSRLPELLELNHLSQTEFARLLDVSDAFISQIISGIRFFSYQMAVKASKILKCTMEELHEIHDE